MTRRQNGTAQNFAIIAAMPLTTFPASADKLEPGRMVFRFAVHGIERNDRLKG